MGTNATVGEYIQSLVTSPRMAGEVVYHAALEPEPGRTAPVPQRADNGDFFSALGIHGLYTHQAEGISRILAGENVVVATPTASGKTLIYNIPVLQRLRENPSVRALYLYPLKALARDQLRAFLETAEAAGMGETVSAAIYDGDTTAWHRKKIRDNPPPVLMTNPDMLHLGLLPYHENWHELFANLAFVVIDEIHTYRGVMGSHMAHVFRRLRRICNYHGSDPLFVAGSATIANPGELAGQLTGRPVTAVTKSGAPRGRRHVVFMNPVTGPVATTIQLLRAALHRGLRTIVYTQSRKLAELISIWAEKKGPQAGLISSYRAGYLPDERRDIERKLAAGELLAVISTSALELGIDIGDLDLCLLVGYPGSVMATWQRGGRVGRAGQESALILIAGEDALDQYFMRNPKAFLDLPPEAAVINPGNPAIVEKHLVCAAAEHRIFVDEPFMRDSALKQAAGRLEKKGELLRSEDGQYLFAARRRPHRDVDLRGVGRSFRVICARTGDHIGDIDGLRVFRDAHPGAVYLHMGQTYVVRELDTEALRVTADRQAVHYYTKPRSNKDTEILEVFQTRQADGITVCTGRLRVTETITGYEKWRLSAKKRIGVEPLDLPPLVFETQGVWLVIPPRIQEEAEDGYRHFMGGIHAIEHAMIGVLPFFVMCDRNDLGGISMTYHPQTGAPAIFIYDAVAGGIGLSRQAYDRISDILAFTHNLIHQCPCKTGCPACVHSPKCGSGNRPIDKSCAVYLLGRMRERPRPGTQPKTRPPVMAQPQACVAPPAPAREHIRFAVFDIETQRSADEVGGWHRADRMGISCAVLYDSATDTYDAFLEHQVAEFVDRLSAVDLVVGFNNKRFDNRVLAGYSAADLSRLPTLDILEEVHKTLGYRLSLDSLAEITLGAKKSASGMQALLWWKQGEIDKIVEYCKKDVQITKDLYLYGKAHGYLLFRNKAKQHVRLPVCW
ncbi:MAG: DEAD/DEAH box helicase [Thermodesulfobacteriota bacterium]